MRSHPFPMIGPSARQGVRSGTTTNLALLALLAALATTLDLGAATLYWSRYDVSLAQILRTIAAWILGPHPPMNAAVLALGLAVPATIYLAMARLLERLFVRWRPGRQWFVSGALYGIAAYVVVFQLLVPMLARAGAGTQSVGWVATCLLVHGFGIGPMMAWALSRSARLR